MKTTDEPSIPEEIEIRGAIPGEYIAPETRYFRTRAQFDTAVGRDFIDHANRVTSTGDEFFVGLAHGLSPSGAYEYILQHYSRLKHPDRIRYTFTNSRLKRQRDLEATDSREFLRTLLRKELVTRDQIIGGSFQREIIEDYVIRYNQKVEKYLESTHKKGYDYAFLASDPTGRVAAITRKSTAFESNDIMVVVENRTEKELTNTPHFLLRSRRIAFLATKSDKRRALAWLYAPWSKPTESPGFLRYIDRVKDRLTVFVDDKALTWPQLTIEREGNYGISQIRIDLAKPYNERAKKKLPVVLLVHGFLGLNSFDGLLTTLPTRKYIAAAMHYGSVPDELPPELYSHHIVRNINAAITWFGERGHPVYLFDHSMGNIYFLMADRSFHQLPGFRQYLRGRIGANPFFGEEAKHAALGFLDTVILPSLKMLLNPGEKSVFLAARRVIPLDTKKGVRRRGIRLTKWLIRGDSKERERIWQAAKERILYLMSNMDSLPDLNRIPIEKALNRLPAKLFAIQIHSALQESKTFDRQKGLVNVTENGIPVLILKSRKDGVARFVERLYDGEGIEVIDVTIPEEDDRFREHLFHMVAPMKTTRMIEAFIDRTEAAAEEGIRGNQTSG